jgi:hypothetical protein
MTIISPLGRHWAIFAIALTMCLISGGLFIARWSRRGVFRSLSSGTPEKASELQPGEIDERTATARS